MRKPRLSSNSPEKTSKDQIALSGGSNTDDVAAGSSCGDGGEGGAGFDCT